MGGSDVARRFRNVAERSVLEAQMIFGMYLGRFRSLQYTAEIVANMANIRVRRGSDHCVSIMRT